MLPRVSQVPCEEADFLLFSTEDLISNRLFKTGRWDDHLLGITRFFLRDTQNALVLDIGANLGAYAVPIAKHLQASGGQVMAFEPQRIVYYQLCGNTILNRLDNLHAIHAAVGEKEGFIDIPDVDYAQSRNVGAFSIDPQYRELQGIGNSIQATHQRVRMVSLDALELNASPAFIKMDVEGFEIGVLKGAHQFLERHRYPPMLFEAWNFDWFKQGRQELMDHFKYLGYVISSLDSTDYIAQHPQHPMEVSFTPAGEKQKRMTRIR